MIQNLVRNLRDVELLDDEMIRNLRDVVFLDDEMLWNLYDTNIKNMKVMILKLRCCFALSLSSSHHTTGLAGLLQEP